MEVIVKVVQFILALSLLIFIHELGHFFFAKLFRIRVDKFYIFFNPWFSLIKFRIGETEYGIGWIPFGGYCKIAGMIDESMDTEHINRPPQSWEYRSKPVWQRLCVMLGGVFMNVVLALAIYIGISYAYGENYVAPEEVTYEFNDLGRSMGFMDGDIITGMNGDKAHNALDIPKRMVLYHPATVEVEREGVPVTIRFGKEQAAKMLHSPGFMKMNFLFVVQGTMPESAAAEAGILPGDMLTAFNGEPLRLFDHYREAFLEHKGEKVEITVVRMEDGESVQVTLPVQISDEGIIGATLDLPFRHIAYTFWQAIPAGFKETGVQLSDYWQQLKLIFNSNTKAYKSLGGLISIGNIFPGTWDWYKFWMMTAFLSIVLAIMNILPIPALDGGHVVFLLYEVIMRRKPSDKFLIHAQTVGLILLFALLFYANANDIYRFFIK